MAQWIYGIDRSDGSAAEELELNNNVENSLIYDGDQRLLYAVTDPGDSTSPSTLYAISVDDFTASWSIDIASGVSPSSPPAFKDGSFYVAHGSTLRSIDTATQSVEWSRGLGSTPTSALTVVGGYIYLATDGNECLRIDASDGSQDWLVGTEQASLSSPPIIVGDKAIFINGPDSSRVIDAFNISDGTAAWSNTNVGFAELAPAYYEGTLYLVSRNELVSMDPTDGSENWRVEIGYITNEPGCTPAIVDGIAYIGSQNGDINPSVRAIRLSDQSTLWTTDLTTVGGSGDEDITTMPPNVPTVYDGSVYVTVLGEGEVLPPVIVALSADDGSFEWLADTINGEPVTSTGMHPTIPGADWQFVDLPGRYENL